MVGYKGQKYNIGLFGSWATGSDYLDGEDRIIPADFQRTSFGIKGGFLPTSNQTIEFSAFINQADSHPCSGEMISSDGTRRS